MIFRSSVVVDKNTAEIIEEAMRVYMNKRIDETGAGFDYC